VRRRVRSPHAHEDRQPNGSRHDGEGGRIEADLQRVSDDGTMATGVWLTTLTVRGDGGRPSALI
jgi:hypothetical protein